MRASSSARVRWSRRGGVSAARQASHEEYESASSMIPPSTHAMPRTASGRRQPSSSTTLPPHDCPARTGRGSAEGVDEGQEIAHGGVHVVARLRRVGAAVATLVDGDHRVAARVQGLRHAVPEAEVRGQPVDQDEGRRLRVAVAPLDVEGDAGGDGHAHLAGAPGGAGSPSGSCLVLRPVRG